MQDSRMSDLDDRSELFTQEQQKYFLQQARDSADAGNLGGMLEALHKSFALDGLSRQLASKWPSFSPNEVNDIIAEAVDVLWEAIRKRKKVSNLVGFLWKTCDNKACNHYKEQKNRSVLTPEALEQIPAQSNEITDNADNPADELDWERKRPRVIALVRSLVPRLGQHNAQKVMSYILDALEANCMDISNAEIAEALGLSLEVVRQSKSRGFKRLERIVREEGLVAQVKAVDELKREHEDLLEDEYDDEHELV